MSQAAEDHELKNGNHFNWLLIFEPLEKPHISSRKPVSLIFKHFNHKQNTRNLSGDKIALEQLKLIQEGERNM